MSNLRDLKIMANKLRVYSLKSTTAAGSGHPTTCMSCAEIMGCLFFQELKEDDEFILSKGHAAPILWAAYAEAGLVPVKELMNLRKIDSVLEGHPTPRMPLVKVASGSLGQGLPAGVGMALAKRLDKNNGMIYVLLGDGEMSEGSIWEAANSASYYNLSNLCAIVDVNRLGQTQQTMHGYKLKKYKQKFEAFGWNVMVIDGHKVNHILLALKRAVKSKKPFAIIAKTLKGKGFSFVEDKDGWHGRALNQKELEKALMQIGDVDVTLKSRVKEKKIEYEFNNFETNHYPVGDLVSTRTAFGKALVELGKRNNKVVALDGDVKNSTKSMFFFNEFPERSFEFFIAEQNMVGAAVGFSAMDYTPFAATFGAFFSRAYDFIRMAQYSNSNIKLVGSHAGVSVGEDGPSQMGLEDISMFLSMPDSVVLYPCDAVSTEKVVREMARHQGISYMRTTREKTTVIYDVKENFEIGGLKVLCSSKKDKALVIGAGITVHEALKAFEELEKKGIHIRVIDLYSIKPVDEAELIRHAKECKNKVIVVEDHYANGIGSVVSEVVGNIKHLYVKEIPRSGKPEELRAKYKIDANAIVEAVKKIK